MAAFQRKQYKEYYRRLLFSGGEQPKAFFKELFKMIGLGEMEKCNILLDILQKENQVKQLAHHTENYGESALHVAAKFNQPTEIIKKLIEVCPDLILADRRDSDDYFGQTALHIAIVKKNIDTVETILSELLNNSQTMLNRVLHRSATGFKFANTVMMGELPLSVSALTFNHDMVSTLLQNGAEIDRKNTKGDTVFHTLIRFAAIYPQLLPNVLEMFQFLHEKITEMDTSKNHEDFYIAEYDHSDQSYIYFIPNNEDLNPLQLCVFLSQPDIFQYLLNLEHVYCFQSDYDGLLDRKLYDVTEIDSLAMRKWVVSQHKKRNRMSRHIAPKDAEGVSNIKFSNRRMNLCYPFGGACCTVDHKESILEMIFDIKASSALEFIQISTVRNIIKSKWLCYRRYHYIWALFHLLFMILLTVYAVILAETYSNSPTGSITNSTLSTGTKAPNPNNSILMLQKIIFGDLLRFSVIISTTLISFTAGLYMVFKGAKIDAGDFDTYFTTMLLLFKLMIGLADIDVLYSARHPWLAVLLFFVFIVLTYILMFNALIAMMSQTCSLVSENRHAQWRIQQLALILFYEDILPRCLTHMVGQEKHINRYDPNLKQVVKEQRYFLDVCSLRTEYAGTEEIYSLKQQLRTESIAALATFGPKFLFSKRTPTPIFTLNGQRNYGNISLIDKDFKLPKKRSISPIPEDDDVNGSQSNSKAKQKKSTVDKTHDHIQNNSSNNDTSNDIPKSYDLDRRPSKHNLKHKPTKQRFSPEGGVESSSKHAQFRTDTSNMYTGNETPNHEGTNTNLSSPNTHIKRHVDFNPHVTHHQDSFMKLNSKSGQNTMDRREDSHTSVSQQNDVRKVSVEPIAIFRGAFKVPAVEIGFVSDA
ncbi:hypothetical protein CHS0354_037662 [Potamilus streckersoni]|uniref:Ion transport domain-containing protein n=1 Tax=Potamilus streckersoni TaxID=2493646 RepID=A0AAE0T7J0_9BIVA|nr:hypothetical protein CHS0354_037662 [Potamilus streckersoni]